MNFRAPPKPTDERARLTERLIDERGTDTERWARLESLATQWDARAAMAAEWIPAGSRVLDVGAGAMALGGLLKPGCTYQPADVVERRPGCFVVDMNRREFPPGSYDFVTFLGVLEYIHDIEWPLRRSLEAAPRMIVTYCTDIGADPALRRGMGWVNDIPADAFAAVLGQAGWKVERSREVKRGPSSIQLMYLCSRAAPAGESP
jgi:hypothetical protein